MCKGERPDHLWEPEQTCVGTKGDICGKNLEQTYVWTEPALRGTTVHQTICRNQSRHMCGTRMCGVEQTICGEPDKTCVGSKSRHLWGTSVCEDLEQTMNGNCLLIGPPGF